MHFCQEAGKRKGNCETQDVLGKVAALAEIGDRHQNMRLHVITRVSQPVVTSRKQAESVFNGMFPKKMNSSNVIKISLEENPFRIVG